VRGVIEDSRASRAVDDAKLRWPRADDAWNAVTWVLARDPEIGMPLNESGTTRAFTLDGARSIGLPTVTVVYVFDPNTVVIRDVLFEEATYGQSGLA
jgi:hypothetical protein